MTATLGTVLGTTDWTVVNDDTKLPVPKIFTASANVARPSYLTASDAEFTTGDGTSDTPYQITNEKQLQRLAELVNTGNATYQSAYYQLQNDITLTGTDWMPIGTLSNPFKGNFDGNKKTIFNLTITGEKNNATQGLFGTIEDATIQKLALKDVQLDITIPTDTIGSVGALVGYATGTTTINGCSATGSVTTNGSADIYTGGLIGKASENDTDTITIQDSWTNVRVDGKSAAFNAYTGGIVGMAQYGMALHDCYSLGDVSGGNNSGGIAGKVDKNTAESCIIQRCYSVGSIRGNNAGGIAQSVDGAIVENCFALSPSVSHSSIESDATGRVVGEDKGKLSENYAYSGMKDGAGSDTSWSEEGAEKKNGADIASAELYDKMNYGIYIDENGWIRATYTTLPTLTTTAGTQDNTRPPHLNSAYNFGGGDGEEETPYEIETEAHLRALATLVNAGNTTYNSKHYKLINNITLHGEWTPIGTSSSAFKGDFDGNHKIIDGLTVIGTGTTLYNVGLFGCTGQATIHDLGLTNVNINNSWGDNMGALIGGAGSTTKVEHCFAQGSIKGNNNIGGLVGYIGLNASLTIKDCWAAVDCTGYQYVAGILGKVDSIDTSTIKNCYTTGNIEATAEPYAYAAGIACVNSGNTISIQNCYALNPSVKSNTANRIVNGGTSNVLSQIYAYADMQGTGWATSGSNGSDIVAANITNTMFTFGFNDENIWQKATDTALPQLKDFDQVLTARPLYLAVDSSKYFAGGTGKVGDPYTIADEDQLRNLAALVNAGNRTFAEAQYKLTANITLTGDWTPIGYYESHAFKGVFDGDKHTISNVRVQTADDNPAGLFGYTTRVEYGQTTICNLGVLNADIHSTGNSGALVGDLHDTNVDKCFSTGYVQGGSNAGELIGNVENDKDYITITNCYSTADVTAVTIAGGLTGYNMCNTIANCYATGAVESTAEKNNTVNEEIRLHASGVIGYRNNNLSKNLVALNSSVKGNNTVMHVSGDDEHSTPIYAWDGMAITPVYSEDLKPKTKFLTIKDGKLYNGAAAFDWEAAGFTSDNGWTVPKDPYKLPYLQAAHQPTMSIAQSAPGAPTLSVAAGTYTTVQTVTLSSGTADGVIRYTTDGTLPTITSPIYDSKTPIEINETTTIKARVFKDGKAAGEVVTATYTIQLVPPPGIAGIPLDTTPTAQTPAAESTIASVTASKLNVRKGAGTQFPVIGKLARGEQVTLLSTQDDWAKTVYGEDTGYVKRTYLSELTVKPGTFTGKVLCRRLNVRQQPSTTAVLAGQLTRGTPVTVDATQNGWGRLAAQHGTLAGKWICLKYVS